MAKFIFGSVVIFLLSSVFSRVIPTKHDLIVVEDSGETSENPNTEDDYYDPSLGPFIPTTEWQVVKRGQRVPAGLHIRMNLKTKVREAKLMDDEYDNRLKQASNNEDDSRKSCVASENCSADENKSSNSPDDTGPRIRASADGRVIEEFEDNGNKLYFTKSQLKDAVEEFRDTFGTPSLSGVQSISGEDRPKLVRKEFKTKEEVRKELKETFQFHKKSEAEEMLAYIDVLQRPNSTNQEKSVALEDLEDLSHELSNAEDLVKMNGLSVIIHYINQSQIEILQEKAAKVLAAAVQSNPSAQDAALSGGAIPVLLQVLSSTDVLKLKKGALYALSALLRGHLSSQQLFVKLYGLHQILDVVKKPENGNIRLQGLTLITDLFVEQKEILNSFKKKKQVSDSSRNSIISALAQHGWCDTLPDFLHSEDLDALEKVLQAISVSKQDCTAIFKNGPLPSLMKKVIKLIQQKYETESDKEFQDYLGDLRDTAVSIMS